MAQKRNPKGMGSVRLREDGLYEGRIVINGVRKSYYGKKQGDVLKSLHAAKKAADEGTYFEQSRLTVSKWLDLWFDEHVIPSVKPLTCAAYKSRIENHLRPVLGKIKLSSLDSLPIQKMYNDMIRLKNLSPKTVRNAHGILHKSLAKAVELRLISINPSDACTLPRLEKKEIQPLDEKDIKAFLKMIETRERYRDLFIVGIIYWITSR